MNETFDPGFDRRVADWLERDPFRAPTSVLDGVTAAVPVTRQRAGLRGLRWPTLRRARPGLVALAAVALGLASAFAAGTLAPPPAPSPTPASTPVASSGPTSGCRPPDLSLNIYLRAGCTYRTHLFGAPFTVTTDGSWYTLPDTVGTVTFQRNEAGSYYVQLKVVLLGSLSGEAGASGLDCTAGPDPTSEPTPLTAAEYATWVRSVVPGLGEAEHVTLGDRPGLRLAVRTLRSGCGRYDSPAWRLGYAAAGVDGAIEPIYCGPCDLYVVDGDPGVIVVAVPTDPRLDPTGASATKIEALLAGIRFGP